MERHRQCHESLHCHRPGERTSSIETDAVIPCDQWERGELYCNCILYCHHVQLPPFLSRKDDLCTAVVDGNYMHAIFEGPTEEKVTCMTVLLTDCSSIVHANGMSTLHEQSASSSNSTPPDTQSIFARSASMERSSSIVILNVCSWRPRMTVDSV